MAANEKVLLGIWIFLGLLAFAWGLAGIALASVSGSPDHRQTWPNLRLRWLRFGIVVVGLPVLVLGWWVFKPYVEAAPAETGAKKVTVPAYDVKPWHALPVQYDGRVMPFETACRQVMQQITGVSNFEATGAQEDDIWVKTWKRMTGKKEALDPVAVVLQWMLLHGESYSEEFMNWEDQPFILCPHHDLRAAIYEPLKKAGKELTEQQLHGKYISPADLRASTTFFNLLAKASDLRRQDPEKATQGMSPEMKKAEEVSGRLELFDQISQNNPVTARRTMRQHPDPFHFVALDIVPGGAWFSIGDLREIERDPARWREEMKERLAHAPQLYIQPERLKALEQFQEQLSSGHTQEPLQELAAAQDQTRAELVRRFEEIQKNANLQELNVFLLDHIVRNREDESQLKQVFHTLGGADRKAEELDKDIREAVKKFLVERDKQAFENIQTRMHEAIKGKYRNDDPKYRMLHLDYLETRFPTVYRESAAWQEYPERDAERVLAAIFAVRDAYKSGDADRFKSASESFFQTIQTVSEKAAPYPGEDSISHRLSGLLKGRPVANPGRELLDLEMRYNRAQPFMWAWVLMLVSACFFIAFMVLKSRLTYWIAMGVFFLSLALQLFGFYARVAIAGRPPVSNMYETLIWVPFMASVFALVLEFIYRKGVIALAGGVAATLGLIVSDFLPVELGSKISPIVPVLRSNYWLTIHVLTIVSSYAGGALAWMMGNIALTMLAFSKSPGQMVKTLAQFSYRAMQIAVLLLAAGTFLGGWWAAESWGRFWGWDPKEVWALIALVCYVIPLHMRFVGWIKDFGLAVSAVLCFSFIVFSWYGVNFVLAAGLHAYGFGTGSPWMIAWFGLVNLEYILVTSLLYYTKTRPPLAGALQPSPERADALTPV